MKTIALQAADFLSGDAFVVQEDRVYFVQPPLVLLNVVASDRDTLARAIATAEYSEVADLEFASWSDLFIWLDREIVEARKREGLGQASFEDTRESIRNSSAKTVRDLLRVVEFQYLDRFETASRLLGNLRDATILTTDVTLQAELARVVSIVERRRAEYAGNSYRPLGAASSHFRPEITQAKRYRQVQGKAIPVTPLIAEETVRL